MRIAHTSDWHIGRTLHGIDLHEYHAQYFDHLVELVRSERLDGVVVSGDIYDRAIPPVDSVQLLSDTLRRLSELTHVVVTPGNHDSAIRLGFGAALMRPNIHIQSTVSGIARPFELTGRNGTNALIYGLPYLDPDSTRGELARCCAWEEPDASIPNVEEHEETGPGALGFGVLGPNAEAREPLGRSHESVMKAAMSLVNADLSARRTQNSANVLVMAHAFVVGGQASESERDIRIGGVDSVPAGVFSGIDYVALGHLHGAQKVSIPGGVGRYSGSPLAFSFSEMNHKKSTSIVEFGYDGLASDPEIVAAPVPRKLSELTGTMDEVLGAAGEAHRDNWLRVNITDPVRPQEMNARLKAHFPHALVMQHTPLGKEVTQRRAIVVNAQTNPAEVASQFVTDMTSHAPTTAEAAVLEQAIDRARAAERSA